MQALRRWMGQGNAKALVIATALLAMVVAPVALATGEGNPLRQGARNPSENQSLALTRETEIIANTSTYGTRQSNKSDNGGGAVYGCRSKAGGTAQNNEPCIRANNLADGLAFEFNATNGNTVGAITVNKPTPESKPFTTNAPGVATGLNADQVDGKGAADFAAAGDILFATVAGDGTLGNKRGAESASKDSASNNTFTVTFNKDVSKCSYTATQNGGTASDVDFAATSGGTTKVTVDEGNDGSAAVPFHLQVVC